MAAPKCRPGRRPPKPVAPSARPGAAGPDDPGWGGFRSSPLITVDHRPKLLLEGFPVEAWIGALEREGPNPGLHGLGEAAHQLSYLNLPRGEVAPW
jgi:hypothetical protein